MSLIACKNLKLGYEGEVVAENINFEVNSGDYLCIIGDNGSGKTTLVKTILGLNKPLEGEIVFGEGLSRSDIGYLSQRTDVQKDFPASVMEIVLSGRLSHMKHRFFYSKEDKRIAMENMEKLGIANLSKSCFRNLSGGQQQRTLLARALCSTEKILFLDEPVSSLDPEATKDMYEIVNELNKNNGTTIVMISHDIQSVEKYATHILNISDHSTFGTLEEFKNMEKSGGENNG